MKKTIAMLVLGCATLLNAQSLEEKAKAAIAKTTERQEATLRLQVRKPFPKAGLWYVEWQLLAAYKFNKNIPEFEAKLIKQRDAIVKKMPHSMHWQVYIIARVYNLYSSKSKTPRMSKDAEQAALDIMYSWIIQDKEATKKMSTPEMVWKYWGSENHHLMMTSSIWSVTNIFKNLLKYKNKKLKDGTTMAQMAKLMDNYYKLFFREKAMKGLFTEIASAGYAKYTLNTMYNLYDFAEDKELKKLADMFLNVYFADWAAEEMNGARGGSRHRAYPGRESSYNRGSLGYYFFGLGRPNGHPAFMGAVTTTWRPNQLVAELALAQKARGTYESISRRPGLMTRDGKSMSAKGGNLLRYTYHTPQFIMGMSMVPAIGMSRWPGISSQNRRNYITFANGKKVATIHTQRFSPSRGSVYNAEWGVQNKGVMILQVLADKFTKTVRGQLVFFDKSFKPVEKDGWVFVEAPEAYCAVKVVKGKTVLRAATKADFREFKGQMGSMYLELKDKFSPIVFEASAKDKYESFEAFQKDIMSNQLAMNGSVFTYSSKAYKNELKLYTDYSKLPKVDGKTVELSPEFVYKSPHLNADFGKGAIKISNGDKSMELDFEIAKSEAVMDKLYNSKAAIKLKNGKATISTADRGDGKQGLGADAYTYEGEKKPLRGKRLISMMVRTTDKSNNPGVIRFDLTMLKGKKIKGAKFRIFNTGKNTNTIKVLGLKDAGGAEDEFFPEALTWTNFVAFGEADGKPLTSNWNMEKCIELGSFKNTVKKEWLEFSSDGLIKFVNDDTNKALVIMLQGGRNTSSYMSKEGDKAKAPQLVITFE